VQEIKSLLDKYGLSKGSKIFIKSVRYKFPPYSKQALLKLCNKTAGMFSKI
jgi:hypothetical protein